MQLFAIFTMCVGRGVVKMDEEQGLRTSKNRSLLIVNEDFEKERNAAILHFHNSTLLFNCKFPYKPLRPTVLLNNK